MNFLTEAANMEEFARKNEGIAYVGFPVLYQEYTTIHVLVMEYIDGFNIDDKETLLANRLRSERSRKPPGRSLHEAGHGGRLFHADPHPGNLRVRDGKIIWIDMG